MSDPSYALQVAIVSALKAAAIVDGRVYDQVKAGPTFPYVTVGEGDTVGDDNDCGDASEVNTSVHVWSRAVGLPEAKQIAGEVRTALKAATYVLEGFRVVSVEFVTTRFLRDRDGETSHAVVEFRYLVDHQ